MSMLSYSFVQLAILAALILAGIHSYLGFHVVSRGVIFVDISMAQAAAFGGVIAVVMGVHEHALYSYIISLLFTLGAAALISISKTKDNRIPQEAFIGIIYAAFAAGIMLVLSGQPGGTEELEHMLSGSLLTVEWHDIIFTAILYGLVGVFHWVFRGRFFRLSEDRQGAINDGWAVGRWDFLFYATFGLVVTSSVHIAGVLLVFSFLIIPPVIALLISKSKGMRLALGWIVAFIGSILGIALSIKADLPAGPSIIAILIATLLIVVSAKAGMVFKRG